MWSTLFQSSDVRIILHNILGIKWFIITSRDCPSSPLLNLWLVISCQFPLVFLIQKPSRVEIELLVEMSDVIVEALFGPELTDVVVLEVEGHHVQHVSERSVVRVLGKYPAQTFHKPSSLHSITVGDIAWQSWEGNNHVLPRQLFLSWKLRKCFWSSSHGLHPILKFCGWNLLGICFILGWVKLNTRWWKSKVLCFSSTGLNNEKLWFPLQIGAKYVVKSPEGKRESCHLSKPFLLPENIIFQIYFQTIRWYNFSMISSMRGYENNCHV